MAAKRIGRSAGKKALQQLRNKQKFAANQQRAAIQKQINASNNKIKAVNAKNQTNWAGNAYRISLDKRNEANAAKMAEVQEALRKQQKLNKKIANNLNSVGDLASGTAPGKAQTAPGGNLAPVQVENIVFDTYVFEGTPAERDKAKRTSERNQELAAKMTRSFEKIAENTKVKVDQNTDVFSDLSNSINGKNGKGGLLNQMKKWNPIKLLNDAANIFDDKFKDVGKSIWDRIIDLMTLGAWFGVVKDTFSTITRAGIGLLKLMLIKPIAFIWKLQKMGVKAGVGAYKFGKGLFGFGGSGKAGRAGKKLGLLPAKAARGVKRIGKGIADAWFYSMYFKKNGVVGTRSKMGAIGHFLKNIGSKSIKSAKTFASMAGSGIMSIFKPLYSGKAGPLKWVIRLGLPALAVYGLLRFAGVSDETITSTIKKAGSAVWDFFKDSKIVKYLMDIDWSGKAADTVNWLVEAFKDPAAGAADLLTIQMPKLWEFVKNKIRGMGTWFEYELIKPLIAKMIPQAFWSDEMKADYKVGKADAEKYRNSPEGQKEFQTTNKKVLKEWETFMDNLHQKWLKNPGYWWSTDSERIWMPTVEHSRQIMDKYLGGWSYLGGGELGIHINGITRDAIVTKEETIYISRKREVLKALKEILKNRGMSDQELVKLGIKLSKRVQNEYDKQDSDLKKASDEILQQKNKDGSAYKITRNALNKAGGYIKGKAQGAYNAVAAKSTHLNEWKNNTTNASSLSTVTPTAVGLNDITKFDGGKGPARSVRVKGYSIKNGNFGVVYKNGKMKIGGDRSWRNNNPGNIMATKTSVKKYGGCGADKHSDGVDKNWGAIIFHSMEAGMAGHRQILTTLYKNHNMMTIGGKYQTQHSAQGYGNNIRKHAGGLNPYKRIGSMSPDELATFQLAQMKAEGMKNGIVKDSKGVEYTETSSFGSSLGGLYDGVKSAASAVSNMMGAIIQKVLGANYGKIVGAIAGAFGIPMSNMGMSNESNPINLPTSTPGNQSGSGWKKTDDGPPYYNGWEGVDPNLKKFFYAFQAEVKTKFNCSIDIGETKRTQERQNWYYQWGRTRGPKGVFWTKTLKSRHILGKAIDLKVPKAHQKNVRTFLKQFVKEQGSAYGGLQLLKEWDPFHVQLPISGGMVASTTAQPTMTTQSSSITVPQGAVYIPSMGGLIPGGTLAMDLMRQNNKMMGAELNSIRKSVDVLNKNQKTHQDGDLVGIIPIADVQ